MAFQCFSGAGELSGAVRLVTSPVCFIGDLGAQGGLDPMFGDARSYAGRRSLL